MYRKMIKGLVLKEVRGVVRIVGEAQVVRVRVWIMTIHLEGTLPELLKGDHSNTQCFLLTFDCYSFMNHDTTMIQDPMKCMALFLGLLQGKAVTWANRASEWLKKVHDGCYVMSTITM